ncbi:MAG: M24 family metallopeptidase [Ilumatobacteraceae bacterium]
MSTPTSPVAPARPVSSAGRIDRIRATLAERGGPSAMIVSTPSNIRWATGFTGSAGTLVVGPTGAWLVTDGRYTEQAARQLAASGVGDDVEVVTATTVSAQQTSIVGLLAGVGAVGAEAGHMSHRQWTTFADGLGLVAVDGVVESLRRHKDADEIAWIAYACAIADRALGESLHTLVPGVSEREVRDELEARMRRLGADGPSYETIVASGPDNGAMPHHRPSHRRLVDGDLVVIDVGALVAGHHSDMTRSFVVGAPPTEQRHSFDVVAPAQAAGRAAVAPGVPTIDVDAACRAVFAAEGLEELFTHGTGHGVGLDIHEEPFLGRSSTAVLAEGDVVTVEPGLYRVGFGGLRIEDLVEVTGSGHRVLTTFPKDDPCPPSPPTT